MKRIGAHYLYVTPEIQLKNGVVQLNKGVIEDFFPLNNHESAFTEFYTGVLAPPFISLSSQGVTTKKTSQVNDFLFSTGGYDNILDFGENNIHNISRQLHTIQQAMPEATIFDIITWGAYYPEKILSKTPGIYNGKQSAIWLFENIDLINKKILPETTIRMIND